MDHAQERAAAGYRVRSSYLVHNFDSVIKSSQMQERKL